jgi:hypothetical protein
MHNKYVPKGPTQVKILRELELRVHMVNYIHIYIRESSLNPNSNTMETARPQYDHPATHIITQQYSSATFVSLRFQSHKDKFGARFEIIIISVSFRCLKTV